jgi:hypothetical protein
VPTYHDPVAVACAARAADGKAEALFYDSTGRKGPPWTIGLQKALEEAIRWRGCPSPR